jgi:hypothetical protein
MNFINLFAMIAMIFVSSCEMQVILPGKKNSKKNESTKSTSEIRRAIYWRLLEVAHKPSR